jgi:hypothetical protein
MLKQELEAHGFVFLKEINPKLNVVPTLFGSHSPIRF